MTTPLTPRTANNTANKLPPPKPQQKPLGSPSKLKNAFFPPQSPLMSFSPATSPAKGSAAAVVCYEDEFDPFGDMDDSVCSNFSDVTAGAYKSGGGVQSSPRNGPSKVAIPSPPSHHPFHLTRSLC